MRPNQVEVAVRGCLIPALVMRLCACLRIWHYHGAGVTFVDFVLSVVCMTSGHTEHKYPDILNEI